jgi:hypothetical protein
MTWPANERNPAAPGRHVFLVEMEPEPDALVRVLNPFALHAAQVTGLALTCADDRLALRIEAAGVGAELAERLGKKLDALPVVRAVGLGWVGAEP